MRNALYDHPLLNDLPKLRFEVSHLTECIQRATMELDALEPKIREAEDRLIALNRSAADLPERIKSWQQRLDQVRKIKEPLEALLELRREYNEVSNSLRKEKAHSA